MYKKIVFGLGLVLLSSAVTATDYEVTITNLTAGQSFTPLLVMTHSNKYSMFSLGAPASEALEAMAEGGDTSGLVDEAGNAVGDVQSNGGLLGPGESATVIVDGQNNKGRLSVAGMLLPTNDNFVALNGVKLKPSGARTYMVPAYDAGTEDNDQSCQHIPGPLCGGEAVSAGGGEGAVHIGNGIHDLGSEDEDGFQIVGPAAYDWRNPVAMIRVKKVK